MRDRDFRIGSRSGQTGSVAMSETGMIRSIACAGPYRSWAATHCGMVRTHNEDGSVNRPDLGVWAVADGAGGRHASKLRPGDGLCETLSGSVTAADEDAIAERLVQAALAAQVSDNVTAAAIEVLSR